MTNKGKYKIGCVIGRFQPFHLGHSYLIKQALKKVDKIIIGVGSSNLKDRDNPWGYRARKKMVDLFIQQEEISDRIQKIIPIPDFFAPGTRTYTKESDQEWLQYTIRKAGKFDVVIGNNTWVNGIFRNAGYKIIHIPYFRRDLFEGVKIRKLMEKSEKWEDRVPFYLLEGMIL